MSERGQWTTVVPQKPEWAQQFCPEGPPNVFREDAHAEVRGSSCVQLAEHCSERRVLLEDAAVEKRIVEAGEIAYRGNEAPAAIESKDGSNEVASIVW